jgi:hypothetical protein
MASAQRPQAAAAAASTPATPVTATTTAAVDTTPSSPVATPTSAGGARQAMGEWVSEMTGRGSGARAPTEEEIST